MTHAEPVDDEVQVSPGSPSAVPAVADDPALSGGCCLYFPGHTPHWIQVLKIAPKRPHVLGTLTPEVAEEWAFLFRPDPTDPHTVPDSECVDVVLFNHDPQRIVAALAERGNRVQWTPGVHLIQVIGGDARPTFNMSREPVGPCRPRDPHA